MNIEPDTAKGLIKLNGVSLKTNNSGNASILFLNGIFLLSLIFLLGDLARFDRAHDFLLNSRLTAARDMISEQIRQTGEMPAAFRASISPELGSTNSELRECLINPAGCTLPQGTDFSLSMYVPDGAGIRKATGSGNQPARYDSDGKFCPDQSQATFQCPFEVLTQFNVTCAAAPCLDPQIDVKYEVRFADLSAVTTRRLPSIVSLSGSSNPLAKRAIYPPSRDYQAVLIKSDLVVVNLETQPSSAQEPTPVSPVVSYLMSRNVNNPAFFDAVDAAGLTDPKLAYDIFRNRRGIRRGATAEEMVAYIKVYQQYGPALSRAVFSVEDLKTFPEMEQAIIPVKDVENKDLAGVMIEERVVDPAAVASFVNVTKGVDNAQVYRAVIQANLRDADRVQLYDRMLDEMEWIYDGMFASIIQAGVTSPQKAELIRDVGAWELDDIKLLDQVSITSHDTASAVVHSMPRPTPAKAAAFNELIVSSGVTDSEIIHEAAWSRVTTVAQIQEMVEAKARAEAEARRLAQENQQIEQEVAERIATSTSEETTYISGISQTSNQVSPTSGASSSSSTTNVTTTTTSGGGSAGGATATISSQLLSTCAATTCPLITF